MSLKNMIRERNRRTAAKRAATSIKKAAPPQSKPKAAPTRRKTKRVTRSKVPVPKAKRETKVDRQRALAIVQYAASVGEPAAAADLINSKLPAAVAKAELARMADIRAAVGAANQRNPLVDPAHADRYIAEGLTVELAEDRLAAMPTEQSNAHDASKSGDPHGWDEIVANYNAQPHR